MKVKSLSRVRLFATPMDSSLPGSSVHGNFPGWSGLPFPSPGYLPHPGIEPGPRTLQADVLLSEPPEKPKIREGTKSGHKVRE